MKIYTIKDIASIAGVSVTTVSRVLNERPDVSKQTRDIVLKVIGDCHFVRNANAKSLKQVDGEVVAVVIRGQSNPFLSDIAQAILLAGQQSDVTFLLEYIDEKDDEFLSAARLHAERRISAFIMVGSRLDERAQVIGQIDVPFVFVTVDASSIGSDKVSSVSIDDRLMGKRAATYLLGLGHRRIAVFGARRDGSDSLSLRYQGVLDGFSEYDLKFDESRYVESRFTMPGGYESAKRFFSERPDTTAVFAMSDPMAIGVIRALRDMRLKVPSDVSVFGFDGVELGRYSIPSLTTIRQPVSELGEKSVEVLLDLLRGEKRAHVSLDAMLISGESVRSPK